jgi:hypothetical protein
MPELFEFQKFNKIPRLRRGVVITEQIDGTNGQIVIMEESEISRDLFLREDLPFMRVHDAGNDYCLLAGSRSRWLTSEKNGDNYGFGRGVAENRDELSQLGVGRHFGEWWGQGIQRRYGMDRKVFSLFNTARWGEHNPAPACCSVVPVLETGDFNNILFETVLDDLRMNGSTAAPGFMKPEGIVIYMVQARRLFKVTLENDGIPKSKVKEGKTQPELKTSAQWLAEFPGLIIHDPDGWDRSTPEGYHHSFNEELVTRGEFRYRVNRSTVEGWDATI